MFMPANGRFPNYEIDDLVEICKANDIYLIEDSAQALGSYYRDGTHMAAKVLQEVYLFNAQNNYNRTRRCCYFRRL